jgi:hypothetical protein
LSRRNYENWKSWKSHKRCPLSDWPVRPVGRVSVFVIRTKRNADSRGARWWFSANSADSRFQGATKRVYAGSARLRESRAAHATLSPRVCFLLLFSCLIERSITSRVHDRNTGRRIGTALYRARPRDRSLTTCACAGKYLHVHASRCAHSCYAYTEIRTCEPVMILTNRWSINNRICPHVSNNIHTHCVIKH